MREGERERREGRREMERENLQPVPHWVQTWRRALSHDHEIVTWAEVRRWTLNWLCHPSSPKYDVFKCRCLPDNYLVIFHVQLRVRFMRENKSKNHITFECLKKIRIISALLCHLFSLNPSKQQTRWSLHFLKSLHKIFRFLEFSFLNWIFDFKRQV